MTRKEGLCVLGVFYHGARQRLAGTGPTLAEIVLDESVNDPFPRHHFSIFKVFYDFFFLRAVNEKLLNCQSLEPTWGLAPPGSVHPPRLLQPGSPHLQDGGDRVHSGCLTEQSNHVLEGSMQVVVYGQTEPSGLCWDPSAAQSRGRLR